MFGIAARIIALSSASVRNDDTALIIGATIAKVAVGFVGAGVGCGGMNDKTIVSFVSFQLIASVVSFSATIQDKMWHICGVYQLLRVESNGHPHGSSFES
jgi:hypothetical protein